MHTRFSGKSSPLTFDPEIEKTARLNRALHRTSLLSLIRQNSQMDPTKKVAEDPPISTPITSQQPTTTSNSQPPQVPSMPSFTNYPPVSSKSTTAYSSPYAFPTGKPSFQPSTLAPGQYSGTHEDDNEGEEEDYENEPLSPLYGTNAFGT